MRRCVVTEQVRLGGYHEVGALERADRIEMSCSASVQRSLPSSGALILRAFVGALWVPPAAFHPASFGALAVLGGSHVRYSSVQKSGRTVGVFPL